MAGLVKSFQMNNRFFSSSNVLRRIPVPPRFNEPINGAVLPRSGGIASMMRLPVQETSDGLDACFVGIPLDAGATNRSGTRLGPRQIRTESVMIRRFNNATRAAPFESLMVADVGDMNINPFNLTQTVSQIKAQTSKLIKDGCKPLIMGGDHTISYPILQAMKEKYGKVGLVHIDAHTDLYEFGGVKIYHGNGFLRAVEEGLIDCNRTAQIGLRGTGFDDDHEVPRKLGFKVVPATECWHKSLVPLMAEVRQLIGDGPVYISFDIDSIDPAFCPGTGTPEIGGLTTIQALEIIRGLRGLNIVGGDLVEVSPPYDRNGTTALTAANLLFEMLCVMPGAKYYD
eukprot:Seg2232.3 transcript_id=Seg2232.3/GoldUCD/mRNA.D3Y31 product="Agmatinase mitochondrial" protein_id=Seg2232.3/GoldUCD/D3Y31